MMKTSANENFSFQLACLQFGVGQMEGAQMHTSLSKMGTGPRVKTAGGVPSMRNCVHSHVLKDVPNSEIIANDGNRPQFFLDTVYGEVSFGIILILNSVFIGIQADATDHHSPVFLGMLFKLT
jgi:hypothetical protein